MTIDWELWIEVGDAVGQARVGDGRVVLSTPGEDDADLPADRLPGALARLVELGPRPHAADAAPRRVTAGELARALAAPGESALVEGLRRRWRVEARRPGTRRVVEVLDTDTGLWLLMPDGPEVMLVPVTPTRVFRLFVALTG
jgi:hypothetical protein